jgi:hypothetical protein
MEHQTTGPLNIKKYSYSQINSGSAFTLNKLSFNWKELKKFTDLDELLTSRKYQNHYNVNKSHKKPVFLKPVVDSSIISIENIVTMNICLPCYNEEWCEISGTLRSLSKNILTHRKRPDKSFHLHVTIYIIQDGWGKASTSLKEGIFKEWGCPDKDFISKNLKNYKDDSVIIIIPDGEIFYPSYNSTLEDEQLGITFYPIFITKTRNSQKFNSHLLFFALCYLQKPDCVFLTDCGTLYNSDCIYKLTEYLVKKHTKIIGVTGRQCVMSEKTRREINEYPVWHSDYKISNCIRFFNSIYWWFSIAPLQGFEFESTFLLNTAMFNLIGALSVLPGPCQLLWWEHLQTSEQNDYGVLDSYFKHLNMNIKESGIIKANTLLAEDRVLSFAMILRTNNLKTEWVPGASFSYEPMMTWVKLIGQRRRWTNGTLSTYIFYLLHDKGQDEFAMSGAGNNRPLQILWGVQLYQSLLQILSPSFFCIALYESIIQNMKKYNFINDYIAQSLSFHNIEPAIILTSLYFLFYVSWVLIAFFLGKNSKFFPCYEIFMELIYMIYSLVNSGVSIFVIFNILTSSSYGVGPVLVILLFVWVVPFILSLCLSFQSALNYLLYSVPFFLQIVQYVSYIPTFALARLYDLSWGTRQSSTKVPFITQIKFICSTLQINIFCILCNLGILSLYIYIISLFGHGTDIYVPVFLILFSSLIIQILFTLVYLIKLLFKDCKKNATYPIDGNISVTTIGNRSVFRNV